MISAGGPVPGIVRVSARPGMSDGGTRAAHDIGIEMAFLGWRAPPAERSVASGAGANSSSERSEAEFFSATTFDFVAKELCQTKMKIQHLGEIVRHPQMDGCLQSEQLEVAYFPGVKIRFVLDGYESDEKPEEFIDAIGNFLSLTINDRSKASPYVFTEYRRIVKAVGEDGFDFRIENATDVWKHVQPDQIYVSRRPRRDKQVYVQITAECAWEIEHGLQIVYRQGNELSRVSDQDGHLTTTDAFDLPDDEDCICYDVNQ